MPNRINWNPQPQVGSDPYGAVVDGLGLGLNLVNQVQQIKQFEQQNKAAEQQRALEKRKQGVAELSQAFEIYRKTPSKVRPMIVETMLGPAIKNVFPDADLSAASLGGFGEDMLDEAAKVTKNLADGVISFDQFQAQMAYLRTQADEDTSKRLGDISGGVSRPPQQSASDIDAAVATKFLSGGLESLSTEEKVIFDRKYGKDPDLVDALKLVGGNLQFMGAKPEEMLSAAEGLAKAIREAREKGRGGSAMPQSPGGSAILSIRPKR